MVVCSSLLADPEDAGLIMTIFTYGPCFRITQDLNSPVRESCKIFIASLLDDFEGIPVYKKDKSLAFQLRQPILHPTVLSMKPWTEVLNKLQ